MSEPPLQVAVWNAEWAPPVGIRGRRVVDQLAQLEADLILLTESHRDLLPHDGHVALGPEAGDAPIDGGRRVVLWSRGPLAEIDPLGHPDLPHRAFVGAIAETPLGPIDVWCVCIPWADAGVARFGGTRKRWEEHAIYLDVLARMIRARSTDRPLIVAGDFNQYVPRIWGPIALAEVLARTFDGMTIATEGRVPGLAAPVIDHLAHTPDLEAVTVMGWEGRDAARKPMSDHSGVRVDLRITHNSGGPPLR